MYGIFTYIYHKNQPNVGKYTSPMDPMGLILPRHRGWTEAITSVLQTYCLDSLNLRVSTLAGCGTLPLPIGSMYGTYAYIRWTEWWDIVGIQWDMYVIHIFPTWSGLAWIQISEFQVIQLLRSVRKIIQDQHIYFQMGGLTINYSNPIIFTNSFSRLSRNKSSLATVTGSGSLPNQTSFV